MNKYFLYTTLIINTLMAGKLIANAEPIIPDQVRVVAHLIDKSGKSITAIKTFNIGGSKEKFEHLEEDINYILGRMCNESKCTGWKIQEKKYLYND